MALKYCVTDWRGSWTAMQKRRRCDLQSVWLSNTTKPIAGVPAIVPWSWNSMVGPASGLGPWNENPATLTGTWATKVLANNWHLFPPGPTGGPLGTGTPRIIFAAGDFSFFAVDLRINACADELADHLMEYDELSWIDGVQLDYYVNPNWLGAASFADYNNDFQFALDFHTGIGRFAQRLRDNRPDWFLIAQRDQPVNPGSMPGMKEPLNGLFLEQYIGKFASQTSFAQVKGWIADHASYLAANFPGREQAWIIEYGQAGQDFPGTANTVAPPFGIATRDEFLQQHLALCDETGSYFSYDRDRANQYMGHTPLAGKSTRVEILRPNAAGEFGDWTGSFAEAGDQNDGTVISSQADGQRELMHMTPVLDPAEDVLDVTLKMQFKRTGATSTDTKMEWGDDGVNWKTGRDHRATTTLTEFTDENVLHPTADWTLAGMANLRAGVRSTKAAAGGIAEVAEIEAHVTVEYTGRPTSVEAFKADLDRDAAHKLR